MTVQPASPEVAQPPRVRAGKHVEAQIRQAILTGELVPGQKLPSEAELGQIYSVSRPTVREALQSLATAGLIEKVPGASGGSFVKAMDHEAFGRMLHEAMSMVLQRGALDVVEVDGMRRLLDIPSARLAAQHRSAAQLEALRQVVRRQRTTTLDDPEIPQLDVAFHSLIAEASGNRLLAAFVMSLHQVTVPASRLVLSPAVARRTVRQHVAVLRAIELQDPTGASAAMERHLAYLAGLAQ